MCSVARGKTLRRQDVHGRLVRVERRLVRGRDLGRGLVLQAGLDQHPVLAAVEPLVPQVADVGDVLDVEDREAVVQQHPTDEVGEQVAPQVPDVRVAVDGGTAGVHPDATGLDRLDRPDGAAEGVAEAEGHMAMLPGADFGAGASVGRRASSRSPVYSRRCAAPHPAPSRSA